MELGRPGVWYSTDKLDGPQLAALVRTVEGHGYGTLWYPESRGYESISLAAHLLASSTRLNVGSSIANIYARDAFTARRGMATLNALHGDRFILGLGVSHIPMVEGLRGHHYDKPIPARSTCGQHEPVLEVAAGDQRVELVGHEPRQSGAVSFEPGEKRRQVPPHQRHGIAARRRPRSIRPGG